MSPTNLSSDDSARLRRSLEHYRDELSAAVRANRAGERQVTDEPDEADMAEQIIEQDDALRTVAFDKPLLSEVEHALAKLEAGTYGVSELSGKPIPLDRLEAVPWARRTLQEEERHDAGLR